MKKVKFEILITFLLPLFLSSQIYAQEQAGKEKKSLRDNDVLMQIISNVNVGYSMYRTDDYRWNNIYVGTAYGQRFEKLPDAYWQIGAGFNRSDYTLLAGSTWGDSSFTTGSLSIPFTLGYHVFNSSEIGLNLFMGPSYEIIFYQGKSDSKVQRSQIGLSAGTRLRILNAISFQISYSYYPTSLLSNGTLNRSAISVSLGL